MNTLQLPKKNQLETRRPESSGSRPKPKWAGGYQVCDGCPCYPNLTRGQRRPWFRAVRSFLRRKVRAKEEAVIQMLQDAECDWMTFEPRPFHHWPSLTPTEKAQMLVAHILRQGREPKGPSTPTTLHLNRRFTTLDILAAAIAADLMVTYADIPRPPKIPYFRAVQVGLAVRYLLHPEFKIYEHESLRYPGHIVIQRVTITDVVRLRSRHACQRIEQTVKKHAGWFIKQYGVEIVKTHGLLDMSGTKPLRPIHPSAS